MLLTALLCGTAAGQSLRGAWVVCTRDLVLRETLIDHADERELVLRSEYGIRSRIPMDDVLFMVLADSSDSLAADIAGAPLPAQSPVRLVYLTDGQIVRGTILEAELPEQLAFSLIAGRNIHGEAHLAIERVLRITDVQAASQQEELGPLRDDTLITRTGDEIVGFIEGIGPMTRFSLSQGADLDIETSRLSEIRFANEREVSPGIYLSLSDHETLRAAVFEYDNQQPITIDVDTAAIGLDDTGNSTWIFDTNSLRSLSVINPLQQIVSLSEIDPQRIEPTGDRDWAPTPVLLDQTSAHPALASIDLRSPMRVHYALPMGSTRFACDFQAPIQEWTDCVVRVIAQTGRTDSMLLEQRLNASTPSAELNVSLPAGTTTLVVEIDPGVHGPVQDRVLMHQPRLLVEN